MPDHPADLSDLPAIRQLRRNLLVAFEVDERRLLAGGSLHSKPAERHLSLRDRLPRRSLVLLGGALSVFGAAGIAVAAVLGGGQAVTPNEWVAGKLAMDISWDMLVDGKPIGSAKGRMVVTFEKVPGK